MLNFLQDAITILNRDYIRNYCILELIRISKSQQIDADIENDAVFIRLNDNGSFVMLSAPEKRDGELLLKRNLTSDDKYFYTIDEWPAITEGKKLKYSSNCVQLYLP
ncbi:MAG: hypothetical protein N2376_13665, partial [Clostridia bacterium]|nr:hypothetical protein [Clostridia bacterium]